MEKREARKRAGKLRALIHHHSHRYHTLDRPEISDAEFDSLKNELAEIERAYPDLVTLDSPTQRVGGEPLKEFKKVRHEVPMLSFFDAFSWEDMEAWRKRVRNYLGRSLETPYYCELKIDGFAIELVYDEGVLVQGSTRGNGKIGEDVTQNLRTVGAIPLRLREGEDWPRHLVVRGEVFLEKQEFRRINEALLRDGKSTYANPRNLAAGSIRQLDPKIPRERRLESFAYDIAVGREYAYHSEEHEALARWGFKTNPHNRQVKTFDEVKGLWEHWNAHRDSLSYEVDGLVVIIDKNALYERAGVVGKGPRGAIAYKFTPKEATTRVTDVKVQVGRTGVLTPVATLEPVTVGGVTITHATLHNFDEIDRLGLKIGDTVVVSRAGDVIPKITKVIEDLRTGKEKNVTVPRTCPVDGSPVVRDGVYYRCSNKKCGAAVRRFLQHFVAKGAFDIEGLGGKIIDRFLDEGLISDAADIFELEEGDVAVLERFGEKSAENIVREVKEKKSISLPRFLFALGIPHIGEEMAFALAEFFLRHGKTKKKKKEDMYPTRVAVFFSSRSREELEEIEDVGPKVAESIDVWFRDARNRKLIEKLERVGVRINTEGLTEGARPLEGVQFVLTGELESLSREEAKARIRALGGKAASSVSGNTDYVVAGENPGSKRERARKLGVKIIGEKRFLQMLEG